VRRFFPMVLAALSLYPGLGRAAGDWPDGPNKSWFERLQRPDNDKNPHRAIDPKSLSCCGVADTVKTKFKVEAGRRKVSRRPLVCLAKRSVDTYPT